jgi:hypothetical protein
MQIVGRICAATRGAPVHRKRVDLRHNGTMNFSRRHFATERRAGKRMGQTESERERQMHSSGIPSREEGAVISAPFCSYIISVIGVSRARARGEGAGGG